MSAEYYHEGDGIIRERKQQSRRLPANATGLTEFRNIICKVLLELNERKEYEVYHHRRPLCRVILEPL